MLLRPSKKKKLDVHWEGPVEVVQMLSDTNYVVTTPGRRKLHRIYHPNLMKLYQQREIEMSLTINGLEEVSVE